MTTFVVDTQSTLPRVAVAMIVAGRASMISVGPYRDLARMYHDVPLEGGYHARIRTSVSTISVYPRTTLSGDASVGEILAAAAEPPAVFRRRAARSAPSPTVVRYQFHYDDPYAEMKYPSLEYRVLAAWRYWNAIEFFYGYKELIAPWDEQFEPMLEMLMAAKSRAEYELALAEATKVVPDGHSNAITTARGAVLGSSAPPFQTMPVEGKVVVTAITNAEAANAAGVHLGDELLAIDGRPVEERLAEIRRYSSAANETHLAYTAAWYAARGTEGSTPLMRFRRPDGSEFEMKVPRYFAWRLTAEPERRWKMLPNNIGYVDLSYLETSDVPAMFADLGRAKAIIFDMRGYPRGVFVELARRMNITGSAKVADIRIPQVIAGERVLTLAGQSLPKNPTPSFRGKTFMLIDERSISQSEHTGLVLEAVANATFVGSPTAGSNGNVTYLVTPGLNYIVFTGMDVRHADQRQLQRIGLVPDVPVPRTIAATAAGRDEVLEKAMELASQ
jgi:C-terminal processing protease CtpA/Prc